MKFAISCDENPGDPGTLAGGLNERECNIAVGNALVSALRRCGQTVWFDTSITYVQRVAYANAHGFDVLFACAHNASSSGSANGSVFIFCNAAAHSIGKQQAAATNVGNALVAAGVALRWATYDEAVYECCDFNQDTVYCEFLFQSNSRDNAEMRKPSYSTDAAEAAAQGLAKTYGFTYVPLHPSTPTPQPPPGDDDMLYVGPFHALSASPKLFLAGNTYHDPSSGALVVSSLAKDVQIAVSGYRFSTSAVASSDRGAGAGAGADYIWWKLTNGQWVSDAVLDTSSVSGAPIGTAVSNLPSGMSTWFATQDQTGAADDDSGYALKSDLAALASKTDLSNALAALPKPPTQVTIPVQTLKLS